MSAPQDFDEATEQRITELMAQIYGFDFTDYGIKCAHCGKRMKKNTYGQGSLGERMEKHYRIYHGGKAYRKLIRDY